MRPPHIGLPMTVLHVGGREQWALSPPYVRAVQAAGGVPVPIPLLDPGAALWALYQRLDGLLLCGGGDLDPATYGAEDAGLCADIVPARDALELALTRRALAEGLPVLAICRGIQVLNVAAGGSLIQDIPTALPRALPHRTPPSLPRDHLAHTVRIQADSALARMCTGKRQAAREAHEIRVNSTHHQAVDRVGTGLRVTALAPDGIIEAVEGQQAGRFVVGVQWHPEELQHLSDDLHRRLFAGLVRAAVGAWEDCLAD